MSVVLKEAIRQAGCADIKLVAGKNGLTNAVEWVHMVDTTEIADYFVRWGNCIYNRNRCQ